MERFERYETEANRHREEMRELAQEVAAARAESTTVRRFCADRLIKVYEHLSTRDVEMTEALRTMLTVHQDEHRLNQRLREGTIRLEALIGQTSSQTLSPPNIGPSPLPAPSPLPVPPPASPPTEANAEPTNFQGSQKRGISSGPDTADKAAKRQKKL